MASYLQNIRNSDTNNLRVCSEINHLMFDVKVDFTRKVRFVMSWTTADTKTYLQLFAVLSIDSIMLKFLISSLSSMNFMSCDIRNMYLNHNAERKWDSRMWLTPTKIMIINMALYGLKSLGPEWRNVSSKFVEKILQFVQTTVNSDVYFWNNVD